MVRCCAAQGGLPGWDAHASLAPKYVKDMSDDNKNREDDRGGGKRGGDFRVPPRTYIIWIAILGAIPLLMVFKSTGPTSAEPLTQTQFTQKLESNVIASGMVIYDPQSPYLQEVRGYYWKTNVAKTGGAPVGEKV